MPTKRRRWAFAAISAVAISMVSASLALAAAAAAPTATTNPATKITSTGATLNATVAPNKASTTYYFQYGTTMAYSAKTASATANGNAAKSVSTSVSGLAAGQTYHFRIVAMNTGGTAYGADRTFTTALGGGGGPGKDSVTILAAPRTVVWGRTATISGQVTGPGKAGKTVTLKATPFPYASAFKPTGQTATTSPSGTYAFTVQPSRNTRYEVTVGTKTPVTSAPVTVGVHVKVIIHVSTLRPFRGHLVRFFGTVTPAHNGRFAQIQRRTSTGAWRTIASTRLVKGGLVNGVAVSKYSRRIRISHSGVYRVRVNPRDGDHQTGNSAVRTERVR